MKKIKWVFLCVAIFSISLVVALYMEDKHELSTYMIEGENVLYELNEIQIEEIPLNIELLEEYQVLFSIFENLSEKIFILRVKQGKMDEVKQEIETFLSSLEYSEDQMELIEDKLIYENEDIFVLIISRNAQTILDELKVRLDE